MARNDAKSSSLRRRPSRTVPATILALLLLAAGVALLWASVTRLTTDRWPTWVSDAHAWALGHSWSEVVVIVVSIVVGLIGLLLLLSAVVPGRPNAFTLRPPDSTHTPKDTEVVMTRQAVAKLASAQAALVEGVTSVSTTVTGHRVQLAVSTPSAQNADVAAAVTRSVAEALSAAGLDPAPAVTATGRTTTP